MQQKLKIAADQVYDWKQNIVTKELLDVVKAARADAALRLLNLDCSADLYYKGMIYALDRLTHTIDCELVTQEDTLEEENINEN